MPKEVFAEEIERFLGTLDGVAAARVLTTPSGDVAHVYVTAEPAADTRGVRRWVGAALVSAYGIFVEPWRIQVAQPRAASRLADLPQFRVLRVEEVVSASATTAAVQLAWTRGGEERVATGRARSGAGAAHRLRGLAAAAVDAAREALEPQHRHVAVEQVSVVTLLERPAVAAAISVATSRGSETSLGIAQDDALSDAAVAAALDAVTKWMLRGSSEAAAQDGDRRAALEDMRRHLRSVERGGAAAPPAQDPAARPPAAPAEPAGGGGFRGERTGSPRRGNGEAPGGPAAPDPDIVRDLREIRPGAASPPREA